MFPAPSKTVQLLDRAPWTFTVDHGALSELGGRYGVKDPLKLLTELERQGWSWDTIWELAWAASWEARLNRPDLSFLKFISLLPIGEDWRTFRGQLVRQFYDALNVKVEAEDLPPNPTSPQAEAGTGATDSTPPQ